MLNSESAVGGRMPTRRVPSERHPPHEVMPSAEGVLRTFGRISLSVDLERCFVKREDFLEV